MYVYVCMYGSSAGTESTCNAGEPSSIPGSGRSPGEGISYPLQYFWASLVAQMINNLPAMWWENWVHPWVRKIYWRRVWQPTPVFLPGEYPWIEEPCGLQSMGSPRVGHDWATKHIDTYQVALEVKNPPAKPGDIREVGSIPWSGRHPGGRNGNPLQDSCLENPMDGGAWLTIIHEVTKESDTT